MAHRRDINSFKKDILNLLSSELPDTDANQIYQDMMINISLLKEENHDILELRLMNTAFKELRYALKVFKPYRNIPKAAVFGSARTPKDNLNYQIASEFGKELSKKGWMIITGGASGIMQAAMEGAGSNNSFGLNIMLPFEQQANSVITGNDKLINFKYFFTRKLMFLKESEATVLFPGGFGTFDEGFESFTLVQTGKAKPRPLLMVDAPGSTFWSSFLSFMESNLLKERLISPDDLKLINHHQNVEKAVEDIVNFYKNYDSGRFMKDKYLLRVKKPITEALLKEINRDYKDILSEGRFELAQEEVGDDIHDQDIHRLFFKFDRASYAKLRLLIDRLNQE